METKRAERIEPFYLIHGNLDCVGYRLGQLYIRFKSGVSYSYENVPYDYFDALQKVESAGRMFHRLIRGKFRYTKLDNDPFTAA